MREVQRFAYIVSHDLQRAARQHHGLHLGAAARCATRCFPGSHDAEARTLREDFDEAIGFIQSSIDKMDRLIKAILAMLARQGSAGVPAPSPSTWTR